MRAAKGQPRPGFLRRAAELRSELALVSSEFLAERTGALFSLTESGSAEFNLRLYGLNIVGRYPGFVFYSETGAELSEFEQLLLLYYFITADGADLTEKWVSFADLPGGRMYDRAFQGYSGDELVTTFGLDLKSFIAACEAAKGIPCAVADASYRFEVLPRVSLQIVYWLGDEDFPSSCKILFDSCVTHYLPIDGCAIIGSTIVSRIKRHSQRSSLEKM